MTEIPRYQVINQQFWNYNIKTNPGGDKIIQLPKRGMTQKGIEVWGTHKLTKYSQWWELVIINPPGYGVERPMIEIGVSEKNEMEKSPFRVTINQWGEVSTHDDSPCRCIRGRYDFYKHNQHSVIRLKYRSTTGTLTFYRNEGRGYRVKIDPLKIDQGLYPYVRSDIPQVKISLTAAYRDAITLQERARKAIVNTLRNRQDVKGLGLPYRLEQQCENEM